MTVGTSERSGDDAADWDPASLYELGIAYSTATAGRPIDLVAAHRWFNLAALGGKPEATLARAEIAREMSDAEIVRAQRQARIWRERQG